MLYSFIILLWINTNIYGEPLYNCIEETQQNIVITSPDSLSLGVLFIQFADWQTNLNARGSIDSINTTTLDTVIYNYRDYYNLLCSENYYITDTTLQNPSPLSPHSEYVYGSMIDYYSEVSYGKFELNVTIINPYQIINGDTLLVWLTASSNKDYYDNMNFAISTLFDEASNAAINSGWISSLSNFDRYAVVYAGDRNDDNDNNNGLRPSASGIKYLMEEKNYWVPWEFSDIGTHVHEFGHLLGLSDLYGNSKNCETGAKRGIGSFSLMASGSSGFQGGREQRPTHICAWNKIVLGWINPIEISSNLIDVNIPSLEQNDTAFVYFISDTINGNWYTGEYFIIENRQSIGFDGDLFSQLVEGGLLIYHRDSQSFFPNGEKIDLEEADGGNDLDIECGDYGSLSDFFPGTTNNNSFSNWTNPNSKSHIGSFTDFAILNIDQTENIISANFYNNAPPKTPSNFRITGRVGQHPTLHWTQNNEPDISGYNIYRRLNGQSQFYLISTINHPNSIFIDNQVTINRFGNTYVTYHITTIDSIQNESNKTVNKWIRYHPWKSLVADSSENLSKYIFSNPGNRWQYEGIVFNNDSSWSTGFTETRVIGDSLMPNGFNYTLLENLPSYGNTYLRVDSSNQILYFYGYDECDNTEWDFLNYSFLDSIFWNDCIFYHGELISTEIFISSMNDTFPSIMVEHLGLETQNILSENLGFTHISIAMGIGGVFYQLIAAEIDGVTYGEFVGVVDEIPISQNFKLHQSYPNPFNPTTTIRFSVEARHASLLRVYDLTGRLVETLVNDNLQSGEHEIVWNAGSQPSGVYFVRLESGEFVENRKIVLLK